MVQATERTPRRLPISIARLCHYPHRIRVTCTSAEIWFHCPYKVLSKWQARCLFWKVVLDNGDVATTRPQRRVSSLSQVTKLPGCFLPSHQLDLRVRRLRSALVNSSSFTPSLPRVRPCQCTSWSRYRDRAAFQSCNASPAVFLPICQRNKNVAGGVFAKLLKDALSEPRCTFHYAEAEITLTTLIGTYRRRFVFAALRIRRLWSRYVPCESTL